MDFKTVKLEIKTQSEILIRLLSSVNIYFSTEDKAVCMLTKEADALYFVIQEPKSILPIIDFMTAHSCTEEMDRILGNPDLIAAFNLPQKQADRNCVMALTSISKMLTSGYNCQIKELDLLITIVEKTPRFNRLVDQAVKVIKNYVESRYPMMKGERYFYLETKSMKIIHRAPDKCLKQFK